MGGSSYLNKTLSRCYITSFLFDLSEKVECRILRLLEMDHSEMKPKG